MTEGEEVDEEAVAGKREMVWRSGSLPLAGHPAWTVKWEEGMNEINEGLRRRRVERIQFIR